MSKRLRHGVTITLLGIVLITALPVILPAAAILQWLHQRRLRACARKFACLSCGTVLGGDSIRLADEAWSQRLAELPAKNPGVRFRTGAPRIVRRLNAICPQCGARYKFVERERTFAALGGDR